MQDPFQGNRGGSAQRQAAHTSQESASESLRPMLEQAQVADLQALSVAIERSAQYRALKANVARTERNLLEHGGTVCR